MIGAMESSQPTVPRPGGLDGFLALAGKKTFAFWLFLSLLYGQLALALLPTWSDGTYYDYGFLVPFLLPLFFLTRWKESGPDDETLESSVKRLASSPVMILLVILGVGGITFLRLIQGSDSSWRAPLYLHALLVLGITAVILFRIQGRSAFTYWPCFVLVLLAVPLQSNLERDLISFLTSGVLEFSLFYHRMMGLPLASTGETIFANGIPLHVSDGCSGIRSFQSGVFAGFVLGEFLRLSAISRIVLVAGSLGIAFLMNSFRVIYLVHHAVSHPDADLGRVHDLTGYVSLTMTFFLIGVVGWLLHRPSQAAGSA
jgi:exosortase